MDRIARVKCSNAATDICYSQIGADMIFTTNETMYRVTTLVNSLANTCLLNMKLFSRANQQQCHFPYWEQDLVIRKAGKDQIVHRYVWLTISFVKRSKPSYYPFSGSVLLTALMGKKWLP